MGVGLGALRVLVHIIKNHYQGEEGWCARHWMQHILECGESGGGVKSLIQEYVAKDWALTLAREI